MEVRVKESSLHNIADAIREKTGEQGTYKPADMGEAIQRIKVSTPKLEGLYIDANGLYEPTDCDGYNSITVEVEGVPTDEDLVVTGDCSYRFAYDGWEWFINKYGDRITTKDITNCSNMFVNSTLTSIPFTININSAYLFDSMFKTCSKLQTLPKIRGNIDWSINTSMSNLLQSCLYIRDAEELFTSEMIEKVATVKVTSSYSCPKPAGFMSCYSLRQVPSWWNKFRLNPESTAFPTASYALYNYTFNSCSTLDEVTNIPVWKCAGAATSNLFTATFDTCYRLKDITFETNSDGTPIVTEWKNQTIDLSKYVGYNYTYHSTSSFANFVSNRKEFINSTCFNSGITEDKLIYNDETYQLLKDDPDAFAVDCGTSTGNGNYSRYNHDSALNTINSLPDTSAYLATAGGTNTIKFKGASGIKTDAGAINTLTEAEIAIATAKGWTVTFS